MPIVLDVNELVPGMCLANNLVNQFSVLLPHGKKLSEAEIKSLQKRFPDITVQIADPLLDSVVDFQNDSQDHEISREVRSCVANMARKVSVSLRNSANLEAQNIQGMENVVVDMMEKIQSSPVTIAIVEQSKKWDGYLQEHTANVFYLSMLIGNTIRNYIKQERERLSAAKTLSKGLDITPLGTAALFHDIGMSPIEHVYSKEEPLSPEEIEKIRLHPQRGADMLPLSIDPMVKLIVRMHHENILGTGYPAGIPGDKINIFSRILRVADAWSTALSAHTAGHGPSSTIALYEMLYGKYNKYFDPVVLKVFAGITPPFPIGAKLKLKSGMWAIVVRNDTQKPFKPLVIVAFDELGDPLAKDELDPPLPLASTERLRVDSFRNEDVGFINKLNEDNPPQDNDEMPAPPDDSQIKSVYDLFIPLRSICHESSGADRHPANGNSRSTGP